MKMHAAEPCLGLGSGPVSRRTRSKWDAFYQSNYGSGRIAGRRGREYDDCVVVDDSDVSLVDEDSDDSASSSDEEESADVVSDKEYRVYSNYNSSAKEKGRKKVGAFGRPSKKNRTCRVEESVLVKKLADSLWKAKDFEDSALKGRCMLNEKLILLKGKPLGETTLPLKFKFEDCQSGSPEKTDLEKKMDSLFDDLDMGLWEFDSDCTNSSMTDDACTTSTDVDESPAARCRRGDHSCVLDEQIGNVCEYCSKLLLESKYLLPSFNVELVDSPGMKSMDDWDDSIMNQIHPQGLTCGKLESSIRSMGTVLDLIPDSEKKLYPHQLEGFEFLWRNIAGDIHINKLENLSPDGGRGCIISHSPGTGKTRLTIVFLQTFMKMYPSCHPVIIAPRGMLLSWEQELKKWKVGIKFHNLNEQKLSSEETEIAATVDTEWANKKSRDYIRSIKLISWRKGGSILGIGYGLFEKLAGEHQKKRGNDLFEKALLNIPGLLVMDEGHTPRNDQSLMWKALTNVATKRRIILSGTPFQNNFSELYNTLCLVNPQFSHQIISTDCYGELMKRTGRKRKDGAAREEWDFLTSSITDGATGLNRLKKLKSMIEPLVHIHKGSILQKALPGLRDCLIILKPTDLQKKLLQNLKRVPSFMERDYLSSLILVHPALVADRSEFSEHKKKIKSIHQSAGVKSHFLIKLIELSIRLHEKVLVFSEYIDPLTHIQKSLKLHFSWHEGREIIYMDGSRSIKQRQLLINSFNDKKSEAKVLLASQKACSEGINLIGASRVVLLDVSWNPSVERQAICRAYRLGQEKMVYVYHLVTSVEMNKYTRQAEKERISELIFSPGGVFETRSTTTTTTGNNDKVVMSKDKVLDAIVGQPSLAKMVERIVHQPKESDLVNTFGFVDLKHRSSN